MQVPNHPSLHRRGSILYFRRAVPADVRAAFGGRLEVVVSLKTGSLAEAKPKWAALFSEFEVALAKARSPKVERIVEPPTPEVIDEAVRGWWRDHLHAQATNDFGRDNPEIHDRIEDDSRYEGQLLQTMRPGSNRRPPELQTEWIFVFFAR
ncbi:DUF6538 domain-containing protein [Brevundimonas sp. 'scallop']|uniref:DUF6538 domain-containing protein n=1 Tax=Brevundimonas sp. 'scallop' TaxID=2562582 RepID=UPI0013E125E3|nr:DUF6538 domain-containing protein [Brevundimonas sp. 'scallop']QIF81544.1 hypothetical protein E4341_07405 [Brevundimonas sp. 'scallop']